MTSSIKLLGNSMRFFGEFGPTKFAQEVRYRLTNKWSEWRLNVQTEGLIKLPEIGIDHEECLEYVPIGYEAIRSEIRRVPLHVPDACFIDYGSGMGRAVVVATPCPSKGGHR